MKKVAAIILIAVFSFSLFACSNNKITKDNLSPNSVYSNSLGVGIRLGMSKKQVDGLLGEGKLEFESYTYQPENLIIDYTDGVVTSIMYQYPNDDWITKGNFTIGASKTSIISEYGESQNERKTGRNELIYGFNSNDTLTNSDISYGIAFNFGSDDKLTAFVISTI